MAHVRKDTLTSPPEWWKHLRKFNKRATASAERRAARAFVEGEIADRDETPEMLGLHNDPLRMEYLRKHVGEVEIPAGMYCYGEKNCPFWDKAENKPEQLNGFCWLLGKGDWDGDDSIGELWDQCKNCGINDEE
jgi:hypothetical protein